MCPEKHIYIIFDMKKVLFTVTAICRTELFNLPRTIIIDQYHDSTF